MGTGWRRLLDNADPVFITGNYVESYLYKLMIHIGFIGHKANYLLDTAV